MLFDELNPPVIVIDITKIKILPYINKLTIKIGEKRKHQSKEISII
jgi:hypothetical protein